MDRNQIFALLQAAFAGARKDGLMALAGVLALQCTTTEEAQAAVDKLNQADVDKFINEYRGDVDREVSQSNETYKTNLEKKYDLVEKGKQDPPPVDPKNPPKDDQAAVIAAAVKAAIEPLQQEVATLKSGNVTTQRSETFAGILADCKDETLKAQMEKNFSRFSFKDDADFDTFIEESKKDITAANQGIADQQMGGHVPFQAKNKDTGVSSAVSSFLDSNSEKNENAIKGKEL